MPETEPPVPTFTPAPGDQEVVMDVVRRLAAAASAAQHEAADAPSEAARAEQIREAMAEVAEQAREDMRAVDPAAIAALHAAMDPDAEVEPRADG